MGPLAIAALALGGLWGSFKLLGEKKRFVGDYAQTGDEVLVHPSFLSQATLPKLPPGTLWVAIKVQGGDRDRVQGPIVGWQQPNTSTTLHIPAALGSFVVQRKDIFRVVRDGRAIASNG